MRIMVFVAAFAWAASALAAAPERKVVGHTIHSPRDPRVEIRVPENVKYVGSDTFALTKPGVGEFDVQI